jgi:hypothetical protein
MKTLKLTGWILALLFVACPSHTLIANCAAAENANSSPKNRNALEADSVFAQDAALALRHLAFARMDISKKNISGAQAEIGSTLDIMDRMEARFATIRLQ